MMRGGFYIRPIAARLSWRALFPRGTGPYAALVGRRIDFWKATGMAPAQDRGHTRPRTIAGRR